MIYPDEMVIIYLYEAANLLELKNQRGIRFLRPEIFKRFNGITREAVNWLIYPGVNEEPQVKEKGGWYTGGPGRYCQSGN